MIFLHRVCDLCNAPVAHLFPTVKVTLPPRLRATLILGPDTRPALELMTAIDPALEIGNGNHWEREPALEESERALEESEPALEELDWRPGTAGTQGDELRLEGDWAEAWAEAWADVPAGQEG